MSTNLERLLEGFGYPEFDPNEKFPRMPKFKTDDYKIIEIKTTNSYCPFELWNESNAELIGQFHKCEDAHFMLISCISAERLIYNGWKHKEIKRREMSRYVYYRTHTKPWVHGS